MDDCLATCWDVCARATRHNSGNWPFILTKAFYIISAVYRQAKDFETANEYMEKSSEVFYSFMHLTSTPFFMGVPGRGGWGEGLPYKNDLSARHSF